jgi:hypothetical protein
LVDRGHVQGSDGAHGARGRADRCVCAAIIVGAASSARAADRIYRGIGTGISFANLDGSGGSDLNLTGTTTTNQSLGLAVDSAVGRIYWVTSAAHIVAAPKPRPTKTVLTALTETSATFMQR